MKLLVWLEGKKTYISAVCGAVVVFLKLTNVLDEQTSNTLLALFGFGGLAALRAKK